MKKNLRFIEMLKIFGMDKTASRLESDKTVLVEEEFSLVKSRIEYANRVVGVIIGFMITLVLFRSFRFIKSNFKLFAAALVAWISVVFTGWFGSIVVSTNLTPWTVSVHLGFAFLIVAALVFLFNETNDQHTEKIGIPVWFVWLCFSLTVIQMIFGIQVRQAIDQVAFTLKDDRGEWISRLGWEFILHRSFSWVVMIGNGWLAYKLFKIYGYSLLSRGLGALTLSSIVIGVGMAYYEVPAFLQPLHLLASALTFGVLLMILLRATRSNLSSTTLVS